MSLIKLSTIGSGFARLQALGLGEKALAKYHGSDWLKNTPVKKVVEKVIKPVPKVIPVNPWSKA